MQIVRGSFSGRRARIARDVFRGPVLQVAGRTYRLPGDLASVRLLHAGEGRSAGEILFLVVLALTIFGLILALPWLLLRKGIPYQVSVGLADGQEFVANLDRAEWETLARWRT